MDVLIGSIQRTRINFSLLERHFPEIYVDGRDLARGDKSIFSQNLLRGVSFFTRLFSVGGLNIETNVREFV